jgi:hypothetical protein
MLSVSAKPGICVCLKNGIIFYPSVYLFRLLVASFLLRMVQKVQVRFVERVSVGLGKRKTFPFVPVHLFSRLIVANCTVRLPIEMSTQD